MQIKLSSTAARMPSGICVCIIIVYKKESDIFLQSAITISKSYGNTEFVKEKGRGQPYDLCL